MIVHINDIHDSDNLKSMFRFDPSSDPLKLLRSLRPNAFAASDEFRRNWQGVDAIESLQGNLVVGVKFAYDRRYDVSLIKRTARTKVGYNADIVLFRDDLSQDAIERPASEIYSNIEKQLLEIVNFIRGKNSC